MQLAPRLSFGFSLRPRLYLFLYTLLMLAAAVPFCTKTTCEWDYCYVTTSRRLLANEDIYNSVGGYVYPPFQSLFAIAAVPLSPLASRLGWFAVNAVALWFTLRLAWRVAGGPDLDQPGRSLREHLAAGLGMFVGLTYFLNTLLHHQTDIILAGLLFAGVEQLQKNRGLTAATLFGLAAAMKCTPLLFAPYLLWRRRPIAAMWLVVVALAASLLPDLFHSPSDASTWLSKWYTLFLAPMFGAEHRPGIWTSAIIFNQSIIGAVNRWSTTTWIIDNGFHVLQVDPRLSAMGMKYAILAAAGVMGVVSLAVMWSLRILPPPPF